MGKYYKLPEIQRRMRNYLLLRLLITVLGFLLVTFYLAQLAPESKETTCVYLYSLLAVYLVTGVVSLLTFGAWKHRWGISRQQVLIDFVFQAMLIWSTGGIVSIFSPMLFVTLAAATGISSAAGAFILATLCAVFLGGTTLAYSLGMLPASSPWVAGIFTAESSRFVAIYLFASIVALFVISSLGSKLSSGLRHAEHLQKEILESMAEGLLAIDENGTVVLLNEEARKILGISRSELPHWQIPLHVLLRRPGDTVEKDLEARTRLLEAFTQGGRRRLEVGLADASGTTRPVEAKISSILDDKGRLKCRVGLFSDLTLKREIAAAERRIQKLEELHEMAMGIAHEIRNPLASVRGCVQEIARLSSTDSRQTRYAEIVMRESDRLDRIIEDFLRYARSSPPDLVPLSLTELVEEAIALLRNRPDFGNRSIEWSPPERCPRVYADRDRLLQVLLNICINSLQATDSEGGRIGVEIRPVDYRALGERLNSQTDEDCVQGVAVFIRDNGKGIDEESVGKAFTPFFTTKPEGSGLGLSVVDRIVREHLGQVDILPDAEGGTCVRVVLPAFESPPGERSRSGDEKGEGERLKPAVHV